MLTTPFSVNTPIPFPEYPRPQFQRESYLNLNGYWDYAMTEDDKIPTEYDGKILVPFSPEAPLSGVGRMLGQNQTLWYRLDLPLPDDHTADKRLLLHFGAVDREATVYLNGQQLCRHMGGYTAFTVELTDALCEQNELVVAVKDDTDHSEYSRGKQSSKPGGIWYTPQSGIWQTVWLESIPKHPILDIHILPHIESGEVELTVQSDTSSPCRVLLEGKEYEFLSNTPQRIAVEAPVLWSPENPKLYPFTVILGDDKVESYFALRSFGVGKDENGIPRLLLNKKPYFQNGLLDQGYWPEGLYTAPSDEALIYDIQTAKTLGFNMLRKHIKLEPMRWYYHCDRLGMIVWQDIPNGGGRYTAFTVNLPLVTGIHYKDSHYRLFARSDATARASYEQELTEIIAQLRNVPSIGLWVAFNEGWGQFDSERICKKIRELDDTRVIDHASGWHDQGIGETKSLHVYFKPYRHKKDKKGRAVMLTEFGGYNLLIQAHSYRQVDFGYKRLKSREALWKSYKKLYENEILPAIGKGLCAAVYTQLSDVEDELNGIMTYDRKIIKLNADLLRMLNQKIMEQQ